MKTIGLFGGAFNPPHKEHIAVFDCAVKELHLDECVVFPSYLPPHKNTTESVSFSDRMNMCKMAFKGATLSDIELVSEEKNYALNTVRKFKKQYKDCKLIYIMGGDSMADFFKWYKPEELLREVGIAVYPREGREEEMLTSFNKAKEMGGDLTLLSYVGENISSREIRCLSAVGSDLSEFLTKEVAEYVKSHELYNDKVISLVRERLIDKTYNHVIRTVQWALKLNRKLCLPVEEVFYSALLHDVTKNSNDFSGVPLDTRNTPVAHQFSGAEFARVQGFSKNVVQAIMYHTTGKPNMTTLQKLIYSADMTEQGRDFDGVEELRRLLLEDFEAGFTACLKHSYDYLVERGKEVYFLTKDAYEFYNNK